MNKKAQLDNPIIMFVVIIVALMIFAPFMLKIFNSVSTPVAQSLGNVSGQGGVLAAENFSHVTDTLINFWDKVILFSFILMIILLLVSAFLIDAHPFFIILYIFINFMLILFIPSMTDVLDKIYDSAQFSLEITQLAFLDWLRNNLTVFVVGIMVLVGIIIYGKLAFFGRSNNRR